MRTIAVTPLQRARQQRTHHRQSRQVTVFSQMRPSFSRVAMVISTAKRPAITATTITPRTTTSSQKLFGRPSTVDAMMVK